MRSIDVCLSPDLLHLYSIEGKIVVVIDVLRATSCMTTAFAYGVKSIQPVATLEECKDLQNQGLVCAAERDGKKAEGFDLGNSPFSYMNEDLKNKAIGMTTTNGTMAISLSKTAHQVLIASFLNLSAITNYLAEQPHNILLLCSGWKGKVNLEDTLCAGAIIEALKDSFDLECDAPLAAQRLYNQAKDDMLTFLKDSSHVRRLQNLKIHKDIAFCLTLDIYNVIPVLQNNVLVKMKRTEASVS